MKTSAILILIVFVLVILIILPFLTIWSLNTLFALSIPFTLNTYLASLFLTLLIGASHQSSSRK